MDDDPLSFIRRFPDRCAAEVSRQRCAEPCDKVAVAAVRDSEDGRGWPVCAYHARGRTLIPLAELIPAGMTTETKTLEDGWSGMTTHADGSITTDHRPCTVVVREVTPWRRRQL